MRLVIVLTFLGSNPQFLVLYTTSVVAELGVASKASHDLEQVYGWVVASGLRPRVTQVPFVVELLHVLHRLLWRNSQLARDKFLGFDCIKREGTVAQFLVLLHRCDLGVLGLLYHLEKNQAAELVEDSIPLPCEISFQVLLRRMLE